ncbi:hypothetical protein IVB34_34440 [Bradyrhizobium sp. 2]|uniref:hypothetical protein n=1 Tax=unclassified Bradyrhizobium TaxID=2631580 RepID=UPI001FFBB90D|nr:MULTISPECIES: hypothetical protein [unclassified Bradyrhizobium]MCK1447752.1 hypothetical protein [Bradyrhizobium sp. 48]MCK1463321.1 hypothetical protein [Bradyrhizobium sp. 2]
MLLYSPKRGSTIAPTANQYDGRQLCRRLRKLSPAERALLAHDLEQGSISNLTGPQCAALAQVSLSYLNSVRRASAEERERLALGCVSLSCLHNQYRHRTATDADVERIVVKIGPDRVMRALDAITRPMAEAAE